MIPLKLQVAPLEHAHSPGEVSPGAHRQEAATSCMVNGNSSLASDQRLSTTPTFASLLPDLRKGRHILHWTPHCLNVQDPVLHSLVSTAWSLQSVDSGLRVLRDSPAPRFSTWLAHSRGLHKTRSSQGLSQSQSYLQGRRIQRLP